MVKTIILSGVYLLNCVNANPIKIKGFGEFSTSIQAYANAHDLTALPGIEGHGCWCAGILGGKHYGGSATDAFDSVCKEFKKCSTCVSCGEGDSSEFAFTDDGNGNQVCDTANTGCGKNICECMQNFFEGIAALDASTFSPEEGSADVCPTGLVGTGVQNKDSCCKLGFGMWEKYDSTEKSCDCSGGDDSCVLSNQILTEPTGPVYVSTCSDTFTSSQGVLRNAAEGSVYGNSLDCLYTLTPSGGDWKYRLKGGQIEGTGSSCPYDWMSWGRPTENYTSWRQVCGTLNENLWMNMSAGSTLEVRFISDGDSGYSGFIFEWMQQ